MKKSEAKNKLIGYRRALDRIFVEPVDAEPFDMAIEALEKQNPKHVKVKYDKRYKKIIYFCPVCGDITGGYKYCSECGQLLSYEEAEKEG